MARLLRLAALAGFIYLALIVASAANGEPRLPLSSTSVNWSGYAVHRASHPFRSVTAQWTEPRLDCAATGDGTYSSFWVGLDGDTTATVEQVGTEADCNAGSENHSAWTEMYPAAPEDLTMPIRPGDRMAASVDYIGGQRYKLTLSNLTTGDYYMVVETGRYKRRSAEVIAEAPSTLFGVLPLAPFSRVSFDSVTFDGRAPESFMSLERITMTEQDDHAAMRTRVSDMIHGGFSVDWLRE